MNKERECDICGKTLVPFLKTWLCPDSYEAIKDDLPILERILSGRRSA